MTDTIYPDADPANQHWLHRKEPTMPSTDPYDRHSRLILAAIQANGRRPYVHDPARGIFRIEGDNNVALQLARALRYQGGTEITVTEGAWGLRYDAILGRDLPASIAFGAIRQAVKLTIAGKIACPEPVGCGWCEQALLEDGECPNCGWTGICSMCGTPMLVDADNPQYHDGACSDDARAEADAEAAIASQREGRIR